MPFQVPGISRTDSVEQLVGDDFVAKEGGDDEEAVRGDVFEVGGVLAGAG